MKIKKFCGLVLLMSSLMLGACGQKPAQPSSNPSSQPDQSQPSSQGGGESSQGGGGQSSQGGDQSSQGGDQSSQGGEDSSSTDPVKSLNITESILVKEEGKVYVKVTGTQANHTADEFKWAWGLKVNGENGEFVDGKAQPEAADFKAATFDANNQFVLKYCLTDIENLTSGAFYRIYGGTPETYADIAFTTSETGARDATRSYYLRTDQNNSLVFDNVQPIEFTLASVVKVAAADLPDGVTQEGVYLKFGGVNAAGLTKEAIDAWHADGKIAGNFQRVIGGWQLHDHADTERFWKIEGDNVFFYCYIGFVAIGEGWMTHFDCVGGNSGANLQFTNSFWGDEDHTFTFEGEAVYKVYADSTKSGESNYWGCLGVSCEKWVDPSVHVHAFDNAQTKVGNLTPYECSCGLKAYALDFADTNPAVSASKLKKDAIWDVTGLPAGKYEVQLYACAASTTLTQNIRTGNNADEVGRYQFRFGEGDYVDPNAGTYSSYGLGTGEAAANCQWSTGLCELTAENGVTRFEIHWTDKGYSCFIGAVRLVQVAEQ